MDRPKCRLCGKPLQKFTYAVTAPTENPPAEYQGSPVLQVTRKYKFLSGDKYLFHVWLGDWGGYGDNCFCGMRCGYRWAVSKQDKCQ